MSRKRVAASLRVVGTTALAISLATAMVYLVSAPVPTMKEPAAAGFATKPHRRLSRIEETSRRPILVMGLPRSGAIAIHEYLTCLGLRSSHYCCEDKEQTTQFPCHKQRSCGACVHSNILSNKPAFTNCGDYDVYTDFSVETTEPYSWFLPQHFALPILRRDYPDAVWILNTRSTKNWSTNVLHWFSVTNRFLNAFHVPYHRDLARITPALQEELTSQQLYRELELSLERSQNEEEHKRRLEAVGTIYEQHTARVRQFARSNSDVQFIEINVDEDGPEVIHQKLAVAFRQGGTDSACVWKFDAEELDNDWNEFKLKV
jgi:Sulfotransferase domain